jgi:HSP20 family protein
VERRVRAGEEVIMAIVRWTPFSAVTALERDMQTMLDRLMPDRPLPRQFFEWRPAVDMTRQEDELVIRAEVPGIELEDLDIEIEDNVLHIRGERSEEKGIDEEDRYLAERFYGSFARDIVLPEGVDPDELDASYRGGIVTIRVPLPEEVLPKARKIEVKAEE